MIRAAQCTVLLFVVPLLGRSEGQTLPILDRSSLGGARQYVESDAVPREMSLPPNLIVEGRFRELAERMLRESRTFRRQCARIEGAPRVSVRVVFGSPLAGEARATTSVVHGPSRELTAVIRISPFHDYVELIAHEVEHVIEQLDEVDLESRASVPGTGVSASALGSYETTRATRIGVAVSAELRAARR